MEAQGSVILGERLQGPSLAGEGPGLAEKDPAWPGGTRAVCLVLILRDSHVEDTVLSHPSLFTDTNGPCCQGPVHVNHTTRQEIFLNNFYFLFIPFLLVFFFFFL